MSSTRIIQKRVGYANVFLLKKGENAILVDTGLKTNLKKFRILFRSAGITEKNIRLIVLTHTHYDHTGNLKQLAQLTSAPVLVHQNEYGNLKSGFTPIPDGQGRYSGFITWLGKKVYPRYASPKAFTADLINTDFFDLHEFGFEGKVISTPGHTNGSQSVLIDNRLIAGDTFLNLKNGRIFPPFVNEPVQLLQTWEKLFAMDIKKIYPGHGKPFNLEAAYTDYERWKKKLDGEM